MARINVDLDFFVDGRPVTMAANLEIDCTLVYGHLLRLWAWCYRNRTSVIKTNLIETQVNWRGPKGAFTDALISTGMADALENETVRVKGVDDRIQYLEQQSAKGKKSAEVRRSMKETLALTTVQPNLTTVNRCSTPVDYSQQSSTSNSSSSSKSKILNTDTSSDADDPVPSLPEGHITPDELLEIWNTHKAPNMPKCSKITEKRKPKVRRLLRENPDREYWEGTVKRMARSPLCLGDVGTGWVSNFDFLIKPDTHVKVNDGDYDDRNAKPQIPLFSSTLRRD